MFKKKVAKKKTSKKVTRKTPRRNPREGEIFRQQHERKIYESRGPQIPEWLANAEGKEAEIAREKIRKAWQKEVRNRYLFDD